jgi:alanyl-tRNA synthetase
MKASQLRQKFTQFFVARGHHLLPSASLIPENDPSALFINSGMHPLVPYLMGQPHPAGKRLTSIQKCVRTDDIDEVGDTFHHTFFEMLGNWSLGDYFKQEAIEFSWQFLTQELNLDPKRLSVTVFAGDQEAPRDDVAAQTWQKIGIPQERIYYLSAEHNWWAVGRTGPCGPDTEVFYDTDPDRSPCSSVCQPGCSCGKYFEIWNDVFMVYNRLKDGSLQDLPQKNVDTGLGLERTTAILQNKTDNYQTELFSNLIQLIEQLSGAKYSAHKKAMRIIADHLRAATFILADGVTPSNKEQGYVLRRLIRRAIRQGLELKLKQPFISLIAKQVINDYRSIYPELKQSQSIFDTLEAEATQFQHILIQGRRQFQKLKFKDKTLPGDLAFNLFETYGLPLEIIQALAQENGLNLDVQAFKQAQLKHQQQSRQAAAGRFAGGLANQDPRTIKLHTATHLLHQALRDVLGEHVRQIGSNITPERLRFDFTHPDKLTVDQLQQVENIINQKINQNLSVVKRQTSYQKAIKAGALAFFGERYPDKVTVYSIASYSKELCGGPHVASTAEIGGVRITKEESCGAGKRRIYAVLTNGTKKPAHQT